MSYTINGKVFTDHPLMDEMVFHLDRIMKEIVLKDEARALNEETEETMNDASVYMGILNSHSHFRSFPFTKEMMSAYGFSTKQIINYMGDRNRIPERIRDDFLSFCEEYFIERYEEKNNYYRALIGLPEYGTGDKYFVFVDPSWFSDDYLLELIDISIPIHEYTQYQISVLDYDNIIERLQEQYRGSHYEYLYHLGDRRIDLYKARQAAKWDILYIPTIENLVTDRFNEIYQINRISYLQRVYSSAYKIYSNHYEEIMMVMLLCQTYTDMIADIPEWYIRRDVFDLRTCQYFIEAHGVKFFKQIPLKYQINIVKNLNKLIRYKSTNQNIWDILDLFGMDGTQVFKYYLLKRRKMGMNKEYVNNPDGTPAFDLEFVKTPIGDTYDNTIKDQIFRTVYDDITYSDKYWDGEDTHLLVHEKHLEKDFTIEGTKYMSLENEVSMREYQFQMSYFLGLLMDSKLDTDDIKIPLPEISPVVNFRITDLFLLLFCFTGIFDGYGTAIKISRDNPTGKKPPFMAYDDVNGGGPIGGANVYDVNGGPPDPQDFYTDLFGGLIINYVNPNLGYTTINGKYPDWSDAVYPEDEDYEYYEIYGGGPGIDKRFTRSINGGGSVLEYTVVNQDSFWEWMRWMYTYFWVDPTDKVIGFNTKANMKYLTKSIGVRHSSFGFEHGYTLEDLGVQMFIPADSIESLDQLIRVYKSNKEAYNNLYEKMQDPETRDDMVVYQFVFDYLFTKDFDIDSYTLVNGEIASDYVQILKERNYILWKYYQRIIKEPDLETRQDMIRQAMNDVVGTLSYYLSDDCLKYVFGFTSVASQDAMLNYINMIINFFKSFKVHFLDPTVTYNMDHKLDNNAHAVDMMVEIKEAYWKKEHHYSADMVENVESIDLIDSHNTTGEISEVLDVIPCFEPIPGFNMDIDGGTVGGMEEISFKKVLIDDDPMDTVTIVLGSDRNDINGGVANPGENIPYVMVNGGRVEEGWDIWDLDGGGPTPHTEYLNVDGMFADSGLGRQSAFTVSFNVDGGHPGMHFFSTPSMNVRVIDKQIETHLRLHPSSKNLLSSDSNGLLLSKDAFIEDIDIERLKGEVQDTFYYYSNELNDALDNINFASLDDVNVRMIKEKIETYFVLPNQIYDDFMDSTVHGGHVQRIKEYMDSKKREITEAIPGENILGWDKF